MRDDIRLQEFRLVLGKVREDAPTAGGRARGKARAIKHRAIFNHFDFIYVGTQYSRPQQPNHKI